MFLFDFRQDLRDGVGVLVVEVGTGGGNALAPDLGPLNEFSLNTVGSNIRRFVPISANRSLSRLLFRPLLL